MIEFILPDMSCGHCASTVAKTTQFVDPNSKVDIDINTKMVKIESTVDRSDFVEALTEAGYPPAL